MSVSSPLIVVVSAAAFAVTVTVAPALAQKAGGSALIKAFDPNNDGTLDLKEVQEPAGAKLDVLDCDKDGTPNAKELKGLLAGKMLRETDLNNDGTLDKKEHLALVKALFRKANPAK